MAATLGLSRRRVDDGTVVLSAMSVNDPRVTGKPIVVEPITTTEPPTCATCV